MVCTWIPPLFDFPPTILKFNAELTLDMSLMACFFFVLAKETDDSKLLVVRQAYYRCLILGLSVPFLSACGNQLKTFQSYWLRSTLIKQLCTSQSKLHPTLGYVGLVGI